MKRRRRVLRRQRPTTPIDRRLWAAHHRHARRQGCFRLETFAPAYCRLHSSHTGRKRLQTPPESRAHRLRTAAARPARTLLEQPARVAAAAAAAAAEAAEGAAEVAAAAAAAATAAAAAALRPATAAAEARAAERGPAAELKDARVEYNRQKLTINYCRVFCFPPLTWRYGADWRCRIVSASEKRLAKRKWRRNTKNTLKIFASLKNNQLLLLLTVEK